MEKFGRHILDSLSIFVKHNACYNVLSHIVPFNWLTFVLNVILKLPFLMKIIESVFVHLRYNHTLYSPEVSCTIRAAAVVYSARLCRSASSCLSVRKFVVALNDEICRNRQNERQFSTSTILSRFYSELVPWFFLHKKLMIFMIGNALILLISDMDSRMAICAVCLIKDHP